jgi:hypothetical protein
MWTPILVILGLVIFALLFFTALTNGELAIWLWYLVFPGLKRKKEKEEEKKRQEDNRRAQEEKQRGILYRLGIEVKRVFSVEPDTIHENTTQNEIVRVVNLLAYQTAVACVNQDKVARGEKKVEPYHNPDAEASKLKIEWANIRKLALAICPELASRLPHFSEFEPLKSYREEHLQEKANKKVAA